MEKKYLGKVKFPVKWYLTLLKNSIKKPKSEKNFYKTGISLWWDGFFSYKYFAPICRNVLVYKVHM